MTFVISDVPGMPSNLKASDITKNSVLLEWSKPRYDGGSKITSYIIERCDTSRNIWTHAGSVEGNKFCFSVPNLREGSEYHFSVAAENDMGVGDACKTDMPIKVKGQFGRGQGHLLHMCFHIGVNVIVAKKHD